DTIFSADKPVSVTFRYKRLKYTASTKTSIAVKVETKPQSVTYNGEKIKNWKYDRLKGLIMQLDEGSGEIVIE
ncbi:MAG: hypothetical protein JXB48_22590, partial [Candidatus Latescibacteria bacterium]|nr:hypothetical protein [Candidatus Latescibacterota bacterium]